MNQMQQQSPFEWMKYVPTPGEKHFGIAVIRYERRFIFRFKIMPSDHGGYWVTSASMKVGSVNGKDKYEAAFSLDSEYEKDMLTKFIIENVERELSPQSQNASVFTQPQAARAAPAQAYQQPPQQQNLFNQNQSVNDDNIPF